MIIDGVRRFWGLVTFSAVICMGTTVVLFAYQVLEKSKRKATVHTLEHSIIRYAKGEITKEEFDLIKRGLELT